MSLLPLDAPPLSESEAEEVFSTLLDGAPSDEEIEQFLIALSDRGESANEIAGAVRAMRARVIPVTAPDGAVDCCGTGGDGQHTLNVSTAVSLVVAACGVPVAKHGNRAASSKSGAADTLEALGLDMEAAGASAEKTMAELGIGFLFARAYHPALGRLGPIRAKIGKRTIFNLLGPLANPAGITRQLIGIASPEFVPIYAEAKAKLDSDPAMIVSGDEGLDELSLAGGNTVANVSGHEVSMSNLDCSVIGLANAPLAAIRGGDAEHNAAALKALLEGEQSAYRDAVVFNAAATLQVAGRASGWAEGAALAAQALDSGTAHQLLARWIAMAGG